MHHNMKELFVFVKPHDCSQILDFQKHRNDFLKLKLDKKWANKFTNLLMKAIPKSSTAGLTSNDWVMNISSRSL